MQSQPLEQMPVFREEAIKALDSILPNYSHFGSMPANNYSALMQDIATGIDERIVGTQKHNGKIPIRDAIGIFNKRMYITALEYSVDEDVVNIMERAAYSLGYSREHFSRECTRLGIDTWPYKEGSKPRNGFEEHALDDIIMEKALERDVDEDKIGELIGQVNSIGVELSYRFNPDNSYQFYINRESIIYKMAEDVLKEKYHEHKDKKGAFANMQNDFLIEYFNRYFPSDASTQKIAEEAGVSTRTIIRLNSNRKAA